MTDIRRWVLMSLLVACVIGLIIWAPRDGRTIEVRTWAPYAFCTPTSGPDSRLRTTHGGPRRRDPPRCSTRCCLSSY